MGITDTEAPSEYVTPAEASRLTGVSQSTLLRAAAAGKITPHRTPGGHRRYRRTDLEQLIAPVSSATGAGTKAGA